MRTRVAIAVSGLLAAAPLGRARALDPQTRPGDYLHETWGAKEGLAAATVRAIAQTGDGFLWLATSQGLLRFDGIRFVPAASRDELQPLADPKLSAALEGAPGELWLASDGGGGVHRFEPGHPALSTLRPRDGLAHQYARALVRDRAGALWIGTAQGLNRLARGTLERFGVEHGLPAGNVHALALDAAGTVWVGTTQGLARRDGDRWTRVGPARYVAALLGDRDGGLWVGRTDHGLEELRGGELRPVAAPLEVVGAHVRSLAQDHDGNVWVGSEAGLARRSPAGAWTLALAGGAGGVDVRAVFEDHEGDLWVGADRGGGLHRLSDAPFASLTTRDGLSNDEVRSLVALPDGSVLAGTAAGVDRVRERRAERAAELDGGDVRSALVDRAGGLWVLSAGRLSRRGPAAQVALPPLGAVTALAQDARGRVWVGGDALVEVAGATVTRRELPAPFVVQTIHAGASGRLWVGVGRFVLELSGGRLVPRYESTAEGNNRIRALYEDRRGVLWIAVSGHGLVRLDGDGTTTFRRADGLLSDEVLGVVEDADDRLWLTTADGILRVDWRALDDFAARRAARIHGVEYGARDGVTIALTERAGPTALRAADGRLWFATGRGVLITDPRRSDAPAPPPVIEEVTVDGQPRDRAALRLPASGQLSVAYTAPGLRAPERLRFRHRLVGVDADWVQDGGARTVRYQHLPAGDYRLEIAASSGDGAWNDRTASLAFVVAPPFFRTRWFLGACAAALAAAAFGVHRARLERVRDRYQAVLDERGRIGRDMHDTFAQTFVAVSVQLDCVKRFVDGDRARALDHLERAIAAVDAGLDEARRSVGGLRASSTARSDLEAALRAIARSLSATCPVDVQVTGEPRRLPEAREEALLRIGQEALTNAVRHAGAARVALELEWTRRRVRLRVTDDGRGFDPGRVPDGHHGVAGMRERAARAGARLEITSGPTGTRVEVEARV